MVTCMVSPWARAEGQHDPPMMAEIAAGRIT